MESNYIEKYELIDGWAIINVNFEIVSANESYYRFAGIARNYTITDVIHQVDLDDFIEVANSLKTNASKTMVLRMRRVDNSYRWIMAEIRRGELRGNKTDDADEESAYEYLELKLNDIQALKHQNQNLRQMINEYSHLLSLEGELVYAIDCRLRDVTIYRFIDDEMSVVDTRPLVDIAAEYRAPGIIPDDEKAEFEALCSDIDNGSARFVHKFHVNSSEYSILSSGLIEFKGSTYYLEGKKTRIVGTIKVLEEGISFSKNLLGNDKESRNLTSTGVLKYIKDSITYTPSGEMMLMLLQIDELDKMAAKYGKKAADDTFRLVLDMCRDKVWCRGVAGADDNNIIYIAVRDINVEVNARAFIESLRTMIKWRYMLLNNDKITFSIGVSRYPFNGKDYDKMILKARRALEIANEKGHNRFIIYKEMLHGEI
ncbi:putative uncharacterized protein [Bacteroides pectinophilus CAG:437]|jgi:GGDEF domain-containing protein|uniref:GGDEF domain-containing protein n=1 Tax=Bacteroides pectinophilus CAG:437 TaxID=1263051 RepID=R7AQX8_9FIRM|nr:putative uncharacterized protein [Bacteroides pectinophilus CAG:437]